MGKRREEAARGISRREFLAGTALAAGGTMLGPTMISSAYGQVMPGKELPPLRFESYSDSMTVEGVRLYARELAKIGIRVDHRPMAFPAFLGKVYFNHKFTLAMGGFGSAEERIDPDFYLRALYRSKGGFNVSGYSNPEYDKVIDAQQQELDPAKRKKLIEEAQRIWARDLPSWWVLGRATVNPYNTRLFSNYRFRKVTGLSAYSVLPYLELQPTGNVKEVNVATVFRMSSAHLFTERASNGRGFLRFVYDTFLKYDMDFNLKPWAAESYKIVDATTIDIKLRDGMKWHDGRPVTADDAKFTFDYVKKWKPPIWRFAISPVKSAEKLDSLTVRVRLNAPSATFITVSLAYITILPQHIWKDVPEKAGVKKPSDWNMAKHGAVGSGPFKFVSFKKDVDCHVVANRDHWTGGPKLDGVHYIQATGVEQQKGGMENQSIHIVDEGLNPPDGEKLAEKPYIGLHIQPSQTIMSFFLDMRNPLFQDPALRTAMYLATPKKKILDIAAAGGGLVGRRSPLPPVFTKWIPSDLPGDEFNLDAARKSLVDAGYTWKNGVLVMKKA